MADHAAFAEGSLQGTLSRRKFTRLAAVGAVAGAVAVSHPRGRFRVSASAQDASLTFWDLFTGSDGGRFQEMIDSFAANSPVKVERTTIEWGEPYYTKLATSIVGQKPPSVCAMHLSRLPSFAPSGLLEPLDSDLLAQYGITADKFPAVAWERAHYDGTLYAIPLDVHGVVMYYNTEISRAAGLLTSEGSLQPIADAAAFLDVSRQLASATGKMPLSLISAGTSPWRVFHGLYSQLGGTYVSADGKTVTLDDAKATEVLAFMGALPGEVAIENASYDAAVNAFATGETGFFWNGAWEVPALQEAETPFDITTFPNLFGTSATWSDSSSFVIPRQPSLDQAKVESSLTFIAGLLQGSLTWAKGGHVPAYRPVIESEEFRTLLPNAHYLALTDHVAYDPVAWYAGAASQMQTEGATYCLAVLTGEASPEDAVQGMRAAFQKLAETPQPR